MAFLLNNPLHLFLFSFISLWLCIWIGGYGLSWKHKSQEGTMQDFQSIQTATLTLLSLIIGFTFSMSIARYDLRKALEEAEANALGTLYMRVEILPEANKTSIQKNLRIYAQERINYYSTVDSTDLQKTSSTIAKIQGDLWSEIIPFVKNNAGPTYALLMSGMNEVENTLGDTNAAWKNRIPTVAWMLLGIIAICSNLLIGFNSKNFKNDRIFFLFFPFVVATSFYLIAEIDSPRGGIIKVEPENLQRLIVSWGN
jgi:hypothetical protein